MNATPDRRFGGILLAPGYLPRHVLIYLYAAFITVGLFAFVGFFQAYLMNVNLRLPEQLQGRTVSALNFANELVALALVAPFGALADKIGRRPVYASGFLWLAAGFLLYPLARTVPQLLGCALFFSVGVAAIGTMLGTVLADLPQESARGRLVGLAGFCQGCGAAVLVLLLGRAPRWLQDAGVDELRAGQYTLWMAAALCLLSALIVFLGLKRGTPSESAPALPLRRILADGLRAARSNRRLWFAYLLQFGSFGDRVVLGTFLTLRLQQAWLDNGLGMADAADRARWPFVVAMLAGSDHRAGGGSAAGPRRPPAYRHDGHGAGRAGLSALRLDRRSDREPVPAGGRGLAGSRSDRGHHRRGKPCWARRRRATFAALCSASRASAPPRPYCSPMDWAAGCTTRCPRAVRSIYWRP